MQDRWRPASVLGPRDLAPLMREDSARVRVLFDIGMFTCQQLMVRKLRDLRRAGVSGLFCFGNFLESEVKGFSRRGFRGSAEAAVRLLGDG